MLFKFTLCKIERNLPANPEQNTSRAVKNKVKKRARSVGLWPGAQQPVWFDQRGESATRKYSGEKQSWRSYCSVVVAAVYPVLQQWNYTLPFLHSFRYCEVVRDVVCAVILNISQAIFFFKLAVISGENAKERRSYLFSVRVGKFNVERPAK